LGALCVIANYGSIGPTVDFKTFPVDFAAFAAFTANVNFREVNMFRTMILLFCLLFAAPSAWSFCGFYVAKADTKLFNKASKVILARDGNRTVLTMSNDYQGDVKDFAIVIPVPVVLQKSQVHVGDPQIVERLDAFSAPRLVEYFDEDPCRPKFEEELADAPMAGAPPGRMKGADALGVTIEAQFTVGEYDILILSAKESSGLETWLTQNGYKIPQGAKDLLQPYIRQNMKFFVAKVNLKKFEKSGFTFLRPLQMAYESPKFMLPIRLGMANAEAEQDLVAFVLSPQGRAEVTNYRTVEIPSNMDIPIYVKNEFGEFYKSMYQRSYEKEGKNAVFLEYAWDMNWCDPCAADPLTQQELRKAGVFWLDQQGQGAQNQNLRPAPQQNNVYLTRLHVRYSRPKFPEDLTFQTTPNRENFQGRYVLRHPFKGEIKCREGREYNRGLRERMEKEAQTLAQLTGWDINNIRKKIGITGKATPDEGKDDSWWDRIFDDEEEAED
jgi:hypothetical protein